MKKTEYILNAVGADKALTEIKNSTKPITMAHLAIEETETPYGTLYQISLTKFVTKKAYKRINKAIEGNIIDTDFSENDTSEDEDCINIEAVIQAVKKIQETGEMSIPIDAVYLPDELKEYVQPGIKPCLTIKLKGREK